jgi:sulfide:quinone oxidoreductase
MAHTSAGRALAYDALVIAVGARMLARHPQALTLDPARVDDQLHGSSRTSRAGTSDSVAFVVPAGRTWLLPPYELALMTAQRAYDAQTRVKLTIVTPEDEPLRVFGTGASTGVRRLLDAAGIEVVPPRRCRCRRPPRSSSPPATCRCARTASWRCPSCTGRASAGCRPAPRA